MNEYKVETTMNDQPPRMIEADSFEERDGWLVFYRLPSEGGGRREYYRIAMVHVVGVETCRA